jgi:hypothetical protein
MFLTQKKITHAVFKIYEFGSGRDELEKVSKTPNVSYQKVTHTVLKYMGPRTQSGFRIQGSNLTPTSDPESTNGV